MCKNICQIDELDEQEWASIDRLDHNDPSIRRLMGMGLCEGHQVQLIQKGNPMILHVLGSQIGISQRLAKKIQVKRQNTEPKAITE